MKERGNVEMQMRDKGGSEVNEEVGGEMEDA